jgi:leucyl/phenylalanyl-tRNA---protein transferase
MESAQGAIFLISLKMMRLWQKSLKIACMRSPPSHPRLPWLVEGEAFPEVNAAWGANDPAPGLLAAGADLSAPTLISAYQQGIFPWFSEGQPILWWSPDPRMVLCTEDFKLHRSLRKGLTAFLQHPDCEIRIDHDFASVIAACANTPREGQGGTWIVPEMRAAYTALHQAGFAHSIETWVDGRLVGGLYCTAAGSAVFGESMFSLQTDASKFALCALVALCKAQGVRLIDCQQNTRHLASLGAKEMRRDAFCEHVQAVSKAPPITWDSKFVEWKLLDARLPDSASPERIAPN